MARALTQLNPLRWVYFVTNITFTALNLVYICTNHTEGAMSYSYYKSRIETMQSNDVIDVAENLWQYRSKPTKSSEIMDGICPSKMNKIINTLRIRHGFIITIKQILDVTYLQLVGFDENVVVEGKLGRRQSCELTPSINSKINEVFR